MLRRRSALVLAAVLAGALAPAAHATPASPRTAVISMGDSYISGEAGRWAGNSLDPQPGNARTDRACLPFGSTSCAVDLQHVYLGISATDGCHRSDVAEIRSARIRVTRRINIACSGAETENLLPASAGGVPDRGEPPEGDQLKPLARRLDVKLIAVSIGGNDVGFSALLRGCIEAYAEHEAPCTPTLRAAVQTKLSPTRALVGRVIGSIRRTMAAAGYDRADYRLVLQTYPAVVPLPGTIRFGQSSPEREAQGCPLYDEDLRTARNQVFPALGAMTTRVARARGAEVLNLRRLLHGHEICGTADREATAGDQPGPAESEWGRFASPAALRQGQLQELFHPNAYAQRALGRCLTRVYAHTPGRFSCSGDAGLRPRQVRFTQTETFPLPRLRVRARRVHRAGRPRTTCARLVVRSAGRPVAQARVRLARRLRHTNARGAAVVCARLAAGRYVARAAKRNYRGARVALRVRG
jgi:hypothetical protein